MSGPPSELCPSGCVAVVAGLSGSTLFNQVESALEADDRSALNHAIERARSQQTEEPQQAVSGEKAVSRAVELPVYLDVSYLTRTIVPNLVVTPEIDFVRYFLPYAGGPLVPGDFKASYFCKDPQQINVKVLIAVHAPKLSEQQKFLVRRLPSHSREMQVGQAESLFPTIGAITATLTAAAVGAAIGYALGRALQHIRMETFTDLERRELERHLAGDPVFNKGALATSAVQRLIGVKREMLAQLS